MTIKRTAGLLCLLVGLTLAGTSPGADPLPNRSIYQQTVRAAAWVRASKGAGAGWLADAKARLLVTAAHVVGKDQVVNVYVPEFKDDRVIAERSHYERNGKAIAGKVISRDARRDLVLLELDEVPPSAAALKLAAESPGVTDRLHAIGNTSSSQGLWAYHTGLIRQVARLKENSKGVQIDAMVIISQTPINDGDAGGPVVNDRGELVGVATMNVASSRLVGLCIDVSEVREFLARARPAAPASPSDPPNR
jgi:serine protease Do